MHLIKPISITVLIFLLIAILTACAAPTPTQDPNLIVTQIASTVQAQLTQSAALTPSVTATLEPTATATHIPATNTPSGPSATPTKTTFPTVASNLTAGDNSKFMGDITVPDGTVFTAGTTFTKTWRFMNTGKTTWTTDYKLVYVDGNIAGANGIYSVKLSKPVLPGETTDISVSFTAPSLNGTYQSKWIMYSADGFIFGENCTLVFSVGTSAATVVNSPTPISLATATP